MIKNHGVYNWLTHKYRHNGIINIKWSTELDFIIIVVIIYHDILSVNCILSHFNIKCVFFSFLTKLAN